MYGNRRRLWQVEYETVFSSYSGNEQYSVREQHTSYVVSASSDLEDIRAGLDRDAGLQYGVYEIKRATYMGYVTVLDET